MKVALPLVLLAALSATGAARADEPAPGGGGDSVRVLFFDESQPMVIELRIGVDGQPLDACWRSNVQNTFKYLDVDDNQALSMDEMSRGGWETPLTPTRARTGVLRSLLMQFSSKPDAPQPSVAEAIDLDRFIGRFEQSMPAFKVQEARMTFAFGVQLWQNLDADSNQVLSLDELAQLPREIQRLDVNDDEMLSIVETRQFENPFAGFETPGRLGNAAALMVIDPDNPTGEILNRLLDSYGSETDDGRRGVPLERLDLPPDEASRLDADGDGRLQYAELREMLSGAAPHLTFDIQIREANAEPKQESEILAAENHSTTLHVVRSKVGTVVINSNTSQVELDFGAGAQFDYAASFVQQFDQADQDNNNYLDEMEVESNAYFYNSFKEMDRDADGKLFKTELNEYLTQRKAAGASRVEATLTSFGPELFRLLDSDGDGRLSLREVDQSTERARAWDRNGDGALDQTELPRSYRISFGRGTISRIGSLNFGPGAQPLQVRVRSSDQGPAWFVKLDRNRDGDVSRLEFIGPLSLFDKMDGDGNGLIDAREAAALDPDK